MLNARNDFARVPITFGIFNEPQPPRALDEAPLARMEISTMQCSRQVPLFDIHPLTGTSIEMFFADRALETFGKGGAGWFWWSRQRGSSPEGPATGPFATSYAAYRHAMKSPTPVIS